MTPVAATADKESIFDRTADYVSAAMGRPTNIMIWLVLVVGWTALFATHIVSANANFLPTSRQPYPQNWRRILFLLSRFMTWQLRSTPSWLLVSHDTAPAFRTVRPHRRWLAPAVLAEGR